MATYTVKAPDGKTITLQGPDGASQEDIIAQAQALYQPQTAAPKPTPARRPAAPRTRAPAGNPALRQRYEQIRGGLAAKWKDRPDVQKRVLANFDADPRVQKLRTAAGLAQVSTPRQEVRQAARKTLDQRLQEAGTNLGKKATGFESASAGIARGMFGIPEHVAAAAMRFLPSSITGNKTNASYDNILQLIRAKNTAAIEANPGAGLAGELGGNIVGGGAAAKAVMQGARALRGVRGVGSAARAVEGLGTLRKGQKVRNAAKLVTVGAGAGAAQAAGEGSDIATGAAWGAGGSAAVLGGVKAAQVITRPFRDVMRLTSADRILNRLTTATRDALEARAARYRADTGAEPTLFELLPLADRNKILKHAIVGKDNVVEATSEAIRRRARNLGPEMSNRAREILEPQRRFIEGGVTRDMAAARGGALTPDDPDLIAEALDNPIDMQRLRDEEARAIMAPHDDTVVVPDLEDLFPSVPGGAGVTIDPEVETVIRRAAGTMRQRAAGAGVAVRDVTDIVETLRGELGKGGIEGEIAQRAIDHLQSTLDNAVPDAGAAFRQMTDAYAGRSRMLEGMEEGVRTRLRSDVPVGTNRSRARTARNAYDSAEGAAGRSLGQGNKVLSDLGGSPEEALRTTVQMSRNSTGRQLAQNIGAPEADALITAARAQDESAQALASASNKAQSGSGDAADAEMLVQAIAGLHPSSFITTKAGAVRRLLDMTYIPETRARTIVDMIFSQDPAMMRRALNAVGNEPNGATFMKYLAGLTGMLAGGAGGAGADVPLPETDFSLADDTPSAEADILSLGEEEPTGEEIPEQTITPPVEAEDSPYFEQLSNLYATENPDLIELVQRVKGQESGGRQFGEDGQPLESSAGAIGIMQVMPETGPEAAQLAGLEWDPVAYRTDAAYNELLGIAYLSEQLRKYDGDVERALAAYNAGPNRTDKALARGGNWLASMPAETQDYVARIGS